MLRQFAIALVFVCTNAALAQDGVLLQEALTDAERISVSVEKDLENARNVLEQKRREFAAASADLENANRRRSDAKESIGKKESAVNAANAALVSAEDALTNATAKVNDLAAKARVLAQQRTLLFAQAAAEPDPAVQESLTKPAEAAQKKLDALREELDAATAEKGKLEEAKSKAASKKAAAEEARDSASDELSAAEDTATNAKSDVDRLEDEASSAEEEVASRKLASEKAAGNAALYRQALEVPSLKSRVGNLEEQLKLKADLTALTKVETEIIQKVGNVTADLNKVKEDVSRVTVEVASLRVGFTALQAKVNGFKTATAVEADAVAKIMNRLQTLEKDIVDVRSIKDSELAELQQLHEKVQKRVNVPSPQNPRYEVQCGPNGCGFRRFFGRR